MKFLTLAAFAVLGLYLAIGPHELGHSIAAVAFGCKRTWWETDFSWYLWDSWGGPIDDQCLAHRGALARGTTDFAGIAVNLLLLGSAPLLGRWRQSVASFSSPPPLILQATWFIALANYAEAFSYLVVNTLWLSSDMKTVVEASGISRWPWAVVGALLATLVARLLVPTASYIALSLGAPGRSARLWLFLFGLYVVGASAGMVTARIILTPTHHAV
jgi:hypothetical protein